MIDHVGFPVSDYARSKAFYEQALAPLGYTLIMEFGGDHTESGSPAAGFGAKGKPDFWIGGEGGLNGAVHKVIAMPDVRERLLNAGSDPEVNAPEQMAAMVKANVDKFGRIIRTAGIKVD